MNTDLGRRLHDLTVDAPPSLPAEGLWVRGVRRHRMRRLTGVVGAAVVLAATVGGVQGARQIRGDGPPPASPPTGVGHLPRTIHEPSPWSEGTADEGELGVLAAVGSADRKRPQGFGGMVTYYSLYGVSAVDGRVRFLDLSTAAVPAMPGQHLNVALSPDGRKLAFPRFDWEAEDVTGEAGELTGWSVYDTVTGGLTVLRDPAVPTMTDEGMPPVFSGDSRYLVTSYAAPDNPGTLGDSFVAWDVVTGDRMVVEELGQRWLPNIGSGPRGVVWSRENSTYTFRPDTGQRSSIRTERDPVTAWYAPRGTGFAYLGGTETREGINVPWQVYAGPSPDRARRVAGIDDASGILGWRDPTHVVVAITDRDYAIVDVEDGSLEPGRFGGEVNLNLPMLASDLWANELVDGVRPPEVSDPRTPWILAILIGGGGAVAAYVVFWWRRRV